MPSAWSSTLPARTLLPVVDGGQEWRDRAACRLSDPALFYAEKGENPAVAEARRICAGCPVKGPCLDFALATREQHGIWGGLTRNERRDLRRTAA